MTSITQNVWNILDKNPSIRRNLAQGLINTRALAKFILKQYEVDASIDAVISAVRRYRTDGGEEIFTAASKSLHQIIISTKSGLANIALEKDQDIQKLLPKLFDIIQYNQGDVLRIIQADEAIKLLVDKKNLQKIMDLLPQNKVISIDHNLAEINMHFPLEAVRTPGIIAVCSTELAMHGINVMEIVSSLPEIIWFFEEKDILKAYNVLYQLCGKE